MLWKYGEGLVIRGYGGEKLPFPPYLVTDCVLGVGWEHVHREDVDVYAPEFPPEDSVLHHGTFTHHLDEQFVAPVGLPEFQYLALVGPECPDEALVVVALHHQVDVVVPWDVATMAEGTDQGAETDGIADATALAECMDVVQDLKLDTFQFFFVNLSHISLIMEGYLPMSNFLAKSASDAIRAPRSEGSAPQVYGPPLSQSIALRQPLNSSSVQ